MVGVGHIRKNKTPPVRAGFCVADQAMYNRAGFTRPTGLSIVGFGVASIRPIGLVDDVDTTTHDIE